MTQGNNSFNFKELQVWEKSIDLADQVIDLTENLDTTARHFRLIEQVEASSASISSNIAEGKGRYSKKEFINYLYIARGSLYETISLLNLFYKRNWISKNNLEEIEDDGITIAKMINALIKSIYESIE